MESHTKFELTPDQIAISEARKSKKPKSSQDATEQTTDELNRLIRPRPWVQLMPMQRRDTGTQAVRLKVLTWNILAQCLVRRELFPTSDCLKARQREDMISREILLHNADVICLQEVDRLEMLRPVLENAGFSHFYAAAPGKRHGCLIAFNNRSYKKLEDRMILYDEQEVAPGRLGSSIRTRNVGALIALERNDGRGGAIIATTHLFWHPKYVYERARQAGILIREVNRFRSASQYLRWPCVIAGDFNLAPDDPTYSLMVGDQLLSAQEERLALSRVIHTSIDPSVTPSVLEANDEDHDSKVDSDRDTIDTRTAQPADGLLSTSELIALFASRPALISVYDDAQRQYQGSEVDVERFGDRVAIPPGRRGAYEPRWTSYTHYWKTVLDYIFVLDPPNGPRHSIAGFLIPHSTAGLHPGLPRRGVCGSDHISLCADLSWDTEQVNEGCPVAAVSPSSSDS